MRRSLLLSLVPAVLAAQQQAATPAPPPLALPRDEIAALARVQVAITVAHDSSNARRAKSGNKTAKAQALLQDSLRLQVQEIIHHAGLTDAEFRRRTFLVSSDSATRKLFDSVVVVLTGAPLPGQLAARPMLPVPPGIAGTHVGHLVNAFTGTPDGIGLIATALGEARIAAQHAQLAGRQPQNLEYMKTHAGHVIHALDPALVSPGPGLGYGLKKAATGIATHAELAAMSDGSTPPILTHSKHVAGAARNTVTRADQLLALAQKVRAANTAEEAAALVSQMASLAEQLVAGADVNGDGRITMDGPESGLQQADEHARLMLPAPSPLK